MNLPKSFMWNRTIGRSHRKIRYLLVEGRTGAPDLGICRTFGIMAVQRSSRGVERLIYVRDITTDRTLAAELVERCNRQGLSPIHLRDFILDTLES